MIENTPILGGIRIPIPPHLEGPVLKGGAAVCMVLGVLLLLCWFHKIVTQKKAVFGPDSRIKMRGFELIKELVADGFISVVCIALSIFCFLQATSGTVEEEPLTNVRDPFSAKAPAGFNPRIPRSGQR